MGRKKKKKAKKQYEWENDLFTDSDENFYFIAGYTGGFAYGITWEEAIKEGLVGIEELNQEDDDLPF